ncbi:MAG: polysaccharide biosynthesis C-terminal domain-containing protein [Saprospiraceae bacterium]|nr:polysaccharide biosynthesis C-terminal domain-containing protein [Saprospiraceae bacterium]
MYIFRSESFKKGLISSVLYNAFAKSIVILNLFAIAYYFGAEDNSDVYFFLINSIQFFVTFIASINDSVLIPESMRLREQGSVEESMNFLNLFAILYAIIVFLVTILVAIYPIELFSIFSNFSKEILIKNLPLLYGSLLLFFLMVICSFLSSILMSYRYFTTPMIISAINNILAFVLIVIFHKRFGLASALIGLILGYILNFYILIYYIKKILKWKFNISLHRLNRHIKRSIIVSQIGSSCTFLFNYLSIYLLSGFGTGVLSSLNYGQRMAALPTQFITVQFAVVSGIKMNEEYARGNITNLKNIFQKSVKILLFILTPIAVFTFIYSKEITTFLFMRGAFDQKSVFLTQFYIKYLILILPLIAIDNFFARLFIAAQKIRISTINQIVIASVQILLIFILINYIGYKGYVLAILFGYLLSVFSIYLFMYKYFQEFQYYKILVYFVKILIINLCIAYLIYKTISIFYINSTLKVMIAAFGYLILLFVVNFFFNLNDDINNFIKNKKLYL